MHPHYFLQDFVHCFVYWSGCWDQLYMLCNNRTFLQHAGVYTFDMLSKQTCEQLIEEVHHFETWCKTHQLRVNRPNSMNQYGAILDDFGFHPVLDE